MAIIYLAYNNRDREQVLQYRKALEKAGHSTITMGPNPVNGIPEGMEKADGILVFWSQAAIPGIDVAVELEQAVSHALSGKLLMVLTLDNYPIPEFALPVVEFLSATREVDDNVSYINELLGTRMVTPPTQEELTPSLFAELFHYFLSNLAPKYSLGEWEYIGPTDLAFDTPAGPWKEDGFLFQSPDYTFILRSVAGSAYLAVESVNLQGQLANVALGNADKYISQDGRVTIRETFDMTAGSGRRSRVDVRAAFEKVGMSGDVITSFEEDIVVWSQVLMDVLEWAKYREEAKKELLGLRKSGVQEPTPVVAEYSLSKYWLLRISEVDSYTKVGSEEEHNIILEDIFGPSNELTIMREAKEGDQGIAYDFSLKSAVFLFEITKSVHKFRSDGEGIRYVVTRIFEKSIPLSAFGRYIDFASHLGDSFSQKGLFEITLEQYLDIIDLALSPATSRHIISSVSPDSSAKEIKDELGFEDDVTALASVMAYREVQPPLAIGLFGNWGTGKSFFMNKLQHRIEGLQSDPSGVFCERVLQINFNSWHYSDSNLWASLITKIFEELQNYGKGNPEELGNLLTGLNSTQELLQETKDEKSRIEREIESLTLAKQVFDQQVEKQVQELKPLPWDVIFAGLLKDESVQQDIKELKDEYAFVDIREHEDIAQNIRKLDTLWGKLWEAVKLLYSFKSLKLACILLGTFIFAGLVYVLVPNSDALRDNFKGYKETAFAVSLFLSQVLVFLGPAVKRLDGVLGRLRSLKKTVDNLKEDARKTFLEEQKAYEQKLAASKADADAVQLKIDLLEIKKLKLEGDIKEMASGKTILRFIESRVSDTRYMNSLGIISWVRKDFERLDVLLGQQKKARALDNIGEVSNDFHLDRIILYIDDLDRCNETTVMHVLEAIHLLLAFPLFVVVVGVDPRWVHKALNKQYAGLLNTAHKSENSSGTDADFAASSYDYLEKIFQIPFALKPMNELGKAGLIRAQLESKKKTVDTPQPTGAASDTPAVDVPEKPDTPDAPDTPKNDTPPVHTPPGGTVPPKDEPEVIIHPETLEVDHEEVRFMEEISFLIGDSPRTIKRFVNMYRIIRTHETFKTNATEEYFAAILLLATITGLPNEADYFFEKLREQHSIDSQVAFTAFLNDYKAFDAAAGHTLTRLYEKNNEPYKLQEKLASIQIEHFIKHMHLVSRFSFRDMN